MKIDSKFIEKHNIPVPRYTSYPPALYFHNNFEALKPLHLIQESNATETALISFYIHIPFCKKICHFCGCNAYKPTKKSIVEDYLIALKKEISTITRHIDKSRKVAQIHYGGGTPNAIAAHYLKEINELFFNAFDFTDSPEIAIECNPAQLDEPYIDELIDAGFNRISIGVQDFDSEILKTINRDPSYLPLEKLIDYFRTKKSDISINLDFIYGLPGQTVESFCDSIKQAIAIKPERLVTFSYAHVPWVKKHQQILEKKGLPDSDTKLQMFLSSRKLLLDAGYIPIGLDHYVLPKDELNIAYQTKTLHRNFQGYCTRKTTGQVYAFGVSAISQLDNAYLQNFKDTHTYISYINKGLLPFEKGYELNETEKMIRESVSNIMCNNYLDFEELAQRFHKSIEDFKNQIHFNIEKFEPFIEDQLIELTNTALNVSETGSFIVRNIAAALDPQYKATHATYSKSI